MRSFQGHSDNFVPLVSLGVAAAAALLYILWNPGQGTSSKRSGKRRKVAGLENLGNTCYLNTVLQSLAACPAFLAWLNRALRRRCFKGKGNELAYKLSCTLEGVNDYSSSTIYSPHGVLYALYNRNWRPGQEQQDAHELFQFLLSELSEDREQPPSPLPLSEAPKLVHVSNGPLSKSGLRSSIKANLPRVPTNRDVDSPFRGLLANHLSCTICGHKNPVTYTSFDCLSLPIPTLGLFSTLSLDCILEKFTQTELVHDVECLQCSKQRPAPKPRGSDGGVGVVESSGSTSSSSAALEGISNGPSPAPSRTPRDSDSTSGGVAAGVTPHREGVGMMMTNGVAPTPKEGPNKGKGSGDAAPMIVGPTQPPAKRCKRVFQKQMTIGKLPQCLCIHIQRVGWQPNGLPFRREEHIMFPEVLDMGQYRLASVNATCNSGGIGVRRSLRMVQDAKLTNGHAGTDKRPPTQQPSHTFIGDSFLSPTRPASLRLVGGGWISALTGEGEEGGESGEGETDNSTLLEEDLGAGYLDSTSQSSRPAESKYKLVSAVVHVGTAFSGHFMTYRRGPSKPNEPLTKNWLCVSDESVYTAQLPDVLSQKAYMLYYQRD